MNGSYSFNFVFGFETILRAFDFWFGVTMFECEDLCSAFVLETWILTLLNLASMFVDLLLGVHVLGMGMHLLFEHIDF